MLCELREAALENPQPPAVAMSDEFQTGYVVDLALATAPKDFAV